MPDGSNIVAPVDAPPASSIRPNPDYVPAYQEQPPSWLYDVDQGTGVSRTTYFGEVFIGGQAAGNRVATQADIAASTTGVSSFNTRTGAVTLTLGDVTGAGGAPLASPGFTGTPTAPTAAPGTATTQLASTAFVTAAIGVVQGASVASFNGRVGAVNLTTGDVTGAGGAPVASPALTGTPTAPTASAGTASSQIATTQFVSNAIAGAVVSWNGRTGSVSLQLSDVLSVGGAPINSPTFTGVPAVPTAAPGTATTQAASTAFVTNAVTGATVGVSSFNTRQGAVTLTTADVVAAGGAPITSPNLTGTPLAPTATAGTSTTQLATTAFVANAIAAQSTGVTTWNGRNGVVTLQLADITSVGGAPLASPTFTGTPVSTTPAPGDNSTKIATTAYVAAYAPLASPALTGTPTVPTAAPATNTTQAASTAFVTAALPVASSTAPVMDGVAAVGTGTTWARADHVHPTDTSRAAASALAGYLPLAGGTLTGAVNGTSLTMSGPVNGASATMSGSIISTNGIVVSQTATNPGFFLRNASATVTGYLQFDTPSGQVQLFNNFAGGGQAAITITPTFNVNCAPYCPGGGAWGNASDARIKSVLGDYTTGLDAILALRPISYRYRGNDTESASGISPHKVAAERGTVFVGLVAQEAEHAFPGMVTKRKGFIDGREHGDVRDLNNSELVYALVNAVKALATRVAALESL